jgi:hypothetical protein
MVKLKVLGKSDRESFIYETTTSRNAAEVTSELAEIWNMRLRLSWYITVSKGLCKEHPNEFTPELQQVAEAAERYIGNANGIQVNTAAELKQHIENIQGSVKKSYIAEAADLAKTAKDMADLDTPTEDQMRKQAIINVLDDGNLADQNEILDPEASQAWTCGKRWDKDETVAKYTSANEKTTMTVKLTKTGAAAPARTPALTAQDQHDMMKWWQKKQDEEKRLAEDDEITYGDAAWADPRSLQKHFQGTATSMKLPPGRIM